MTDPTKSDSDMPYALELDKEVDAVLVDIKKEDNGFYICKNWFAKQSFSVFPTSGYKPVFLKHVNDGLWCEFSTEVHHYQQYQTKITWFYKICILVPTIWFLAVFFPDLLWYYEIVFKGAPVICGLILAIAFAVDTYYQRRFQRKKIHPMFSLLVETYKSRFLLHGYKIAYQFEPTFMDGMNSFIIFRKATESDTQESLVRSDIDSSQFGFYLDEDLIGRKPYALGMASRIHPPRFLQGIDNITWKGFVKAIDDRSKTPRNYLLGYTIAMSLLLGFFLSVLIYALVVFAEVRYLLMIAFFPVLALGEIMVSFRRRHYLENVLAQEMNDTVIAEYRRYFTVAGYEIKFDLEYVYHYLCCNSYFNFIKLNASTSKEGNLVW